MEMPILDLWRIGKFRYLIQKSILLYYNVEQEQHNINIRNDSFFIQ